MIIKAHNSTCELRTKNQKQLEQLRHHKHTLEWLIPSAEIVNKAKNIDSIIKLKECNRFEIKEGYPETILKYKEFNPLDIFVLAGHHLERSHGEKGIYSLHASAIGNKKGCVVVYGTHQCGKTTVCLYSKDKYGLDFLSNEQALIDLNKAQLVGGCSSLNLLDHHKNLCDNYKNKEKISLKKIGHPHKIKAIITPFIDNSLKNPRIIKRSYIDSEYELNAAFSEKIRGVGKRLRGDEDSLLHPLDSLDIKSLAKKRILDLQKFLSNNDLYYIWGNLNSISTFINEKLK